MKYVVIIPDGAADTPLEALDGLTPLQAATTPNLRALAAVGRVGTVDTTPPGFEAGSDVCSMSLLGYDPAKYHTGRAPLEAAALGLDLASQDWIFRVNFVTIGEPGTPDDGLMLDHSAGGITDAEARILAADLAAAWRQALPAWAPHLRLTHGVSYRNILVDQSARPSASGTLAPAPPARDYRAVRTTPPHAIPREPWARHLPTGGEAGDGLRRLIEISQRILPDHMVNVVRREAGLRPANSAWIWGQGTRPAMPLFADRFHLRGAMITAVDLLAGIAALMGWDRLHVPGVTSYHDTDYGAQGRATCDAIDDYDIVCCHVEAPDEASHQGDHATKVAAIEAIDEHIVGPIARKLREFGDPESDSSARGWRLLILPDHYTLVSTRKHDPTPPPFLMAGSWVRSVVPHMFTEADAARADLHIAKGHELMEYFLRSGLVGVTK